MIKNFLTILFSFLSFIMAFSQKITLCANGNTIYASLVENDATEDLIKLLPLTIEMSPYGGFEVVGPLPKSLPVSNSQIDTEPGDIMLYQGNQLVIFYGNNSWSYTPIGKIDGGDAETVKQFLGEGKVSVTLSKENAGIIEIKREDIGNPEVYDLNGLKIDSENITPGIYIIEGRKTLIR